MSLLLTVQQCTSEQSFQTESTINNYRYVTPGRSDLPCNGSKPCLTLEEYANNPGTYFISDTIFYFYPGKHELNTSLELCDIHHLHFQAMNYGIVNITFDELVNITCINCTDVSLSSINFYVTENFTHLFLFDSMSAINLSNIAIISNMNRVGCSAILIKDSEANLVNSSFIGILGIYGSALAVYRSNVTFSGNSNFGHNHGFVGGAIFSVNSSLIFTGSNTFVNNTVLDRWYADTDTALCGSSELEVYNNIIISGFGGAITSRCSSVDWSDHPESKGNCSFLKISGNSTFIENQALIGGAIEADLSSLTFEGLVEFVNNSVGQYGRALSISGQSEVIFMVERVSFSNNTSAHYGGALMIYDATVFFDESQNSTEFIGNSAGHELTAGGAIGCQSCTLFFKSNTIFTENTASYGGAVSITNSLMMDFYGQQLLCISITLSTSYGIMQILLAVLYTLMIAVVAIYHPDAFSHLQLRHTIIALKMHHSYLLTIRLDGKVVCCMEEK